MHKEEGLDFSGIKTFSLDEYFRLPPEHPESYHAFMAKNLFNHVNVKPENISMPDGMASNVEKLCSDYERRIKEAGGIDIQELGIGRDNARFFGGEGNVPRLAVTMGVGMILDARKLLMLAKRRRERRCGQGGHRRARVVSGGCQCPPAASKSVTVVIDGEAGGRLKRKEYYLYVERMAEQVEHEIGI